jgi:hypothetical protein
MEKKQTVAFVSLKYLISDKTSLDVIATSRDTQAGTSFKSRTFAPLEERPAQIPQT